MTVVASVEFYRHLVAAFTHPDAPELALFLSEDLPEIFDEFQLGWLDLDRIIPDRSNEYRRSLWDIRQGVPCFSQALLRADGVIELERITLDWEVSAEDWH